MTMTIAEPSSIRTTIKPNQPHEEDNLPSIDKNIEIDSVKLRTIATETQSNLTNIINTHYNQITVSPYQRSIDSAIQLSISTTLKDFDQLISTIHDIQQSSEAADNIDISFLSTTLDQIKQQWHNTYSQSKNTISMIESYVGDAKLALIHAITRNDQNLNEFINQANIECSNATQAMQNIVNNAAEKCHQQKQELMARTGAELTQTLNTYHDIERCLLDDRQSTRSLQSMAMVEFHAQHHSDAAKLHRDLSQHVIDLFLQLHKERIEYLVARNELKYNCRVLEEKQYENKQALLLQHHRFTAAAELARLQGEYARQRDEVEEEMHLLAKTTEKCAHGMKDLHAKAKRCASSHATEILKLRELKMNSFAKLRERLDGAIEKIAMLTDGSKDVVVVEPLLQTRLSQLTLAIKNFECSSSKSTGSDDAMSQGDGLIAAYRPAA